MSTSYILYSNVVLAVLALCYRLLLSRDTNLTGNRIILLTIPFLALLLPYLSISTLMPTYDLEAFTIGDSALINQVINNQESLDTNIRLPLIYGLSCLLLIFRLMYQISILFKTNSKYIKNYNGVNI